MTQYNADFSDTRTFEQEIRQFKVKSAINDAMFEVIKDEFIDDLTQKIEDMGLVGAGVDKGDGPPLSSTAAWNVENPSNMRFLIYAIDSVGDRAYYLNYGTDGPITPTNAKVLKFRSDESGEYIYRKQVDSVKEYGFFEAAIEEFNTSKKVKQRLEEEVSDRVEKALKLT